MISDIEFYAIRPYAHPSIRLAHSMLSVCPLSKLEETVIKHGAQHILTVINDGTPVDRPDCVPVENHLFLAFNDIAEPRDGFTPPGYEHVQQIIDYLTEWNRSAPLVVHCFAGVSRSTAVAYISACLFQPEADEMEIALELRRVSPSATPNPLIVQYADQILGRDGRMEKAIAHIGRGSFAYEGNVFKMPLGLENE